MSLDEITLSLSEANCLNIELTIIQVLGWAGLAINAEVASFHLGCHCLVICLKIAAAVNMQDRIAAAAAVTLTQ